MNTICVTSVLFAFTTIPSIASELGEHPAIIVQRLHAQAGYDYESKFYPHPAWLFLASEPPKTLGDHPAVIVARRRSSDGGCTNEVAEEPSLWTGSPGTETSR
jgi:hypothetical protein